MVVEQRLNDDRFALSEIDAALLVPMYRSISRIASVIEAELMSDAIRDEVADLLDDEFVRFRALQASIISQLGLVALATDRSLAA